MENESNKISIANSKIKSLQNFLEENKINLNKISFSFKYSETMEISKYNYFDNIESREIFNSNKFDSSDIPLYKELEQLTITYREKNGGQEKINLIPKLTIGKEYIPFIANEIQGNTTERIERKKCFNIIALNSLTKKYKKFISLSKMKTAIKRIKKKFADKEDIIRKIYFSNVIIQTAPGILLLEDVQEKLKEYNLLNEYNLFNYYIPFSNLEKSEELLAYELANMEDDYFIIVDDNGIIRHYGNIKEHEKPLEEKIFDLIEKKNEEGNTFNTLSNINNKKRCLFRRR